MTSSCRQLVSPSTETSKKCDNKSNNNHMTQQPDLNTNKGTTTLVAAGAVVAIGKLVQLQKSGAGVHCVFFFASSKLE
jgi:hypothetical protein